MIIQNWQDLDLHFDSVFDLEVSCFGNSSWDRNTWEKLFKNRDLFVNLEIVNGTLTGFSVISRVADEAELLRIAVRKEFRRKGIARKMLDRSIQEELAPAVKTLHLEVRSDNEDALLFYQRYGFKKSGLRYKYYKNPSCDALLYLFEIKST